MTKTESRIPFSCGMGLRGETKLEVRIPPMSWENGWHQGTHIHPPQIISQFWFILSFENFGFQGPPLSPPKLQCSITSLGWVWMSFCILYHLFFPLNCWLRTSIHYKVMPLMQIRDSLVMYDQFFLYTACE